jgi:hypothetical protein
MPGWQRSRTAERYLRRRRSSEPASRSSVARSRSEVGNEDFRIDLLFYHPKRRSFVVVELKSVPFEPAFVGWLNFYSSA